MFSDLWQDDERNLKPEHEWPSEDYWEMVERERHWTVPKPSGETEDKQETGSKVESKDEQESGSSVKSEEKQKLGSLVE